MIGELHIFRIRQPVEDLLFIIDIPIVINILPFTEIRDSGRFPKPVLLRHQTISHLDNLNSVLARLIIDQLDVAKNSRAVWVLLFV